MKPHTQLTKPSERFLVTKEDAIFGDASWIHGGDKTIGSNELLMGDMQGDAAFRKQ